MVKKVKSVGTDSKFYISFVGVFPQNALHSAREDAARHSITNHACSSVRNVAGSVCAFLRVSMVIKPSALATTTGRPRKEDPSALKSVIIYFYFPPFAAIINTSKEKRTVIPSSCLCNCQFIVGLNLLADQSPTILVNVFSYYNN